MRALIFANGSPTSSELVEEWMQRDSIVIAANGGTLNALLSNTTPQIVIGDLDSFPDAMRDDLQRRNVKFIAYPERKNETDLELALRHALDLGATEIAIFGALGRRWDQTLANILLLTLPELHAVPTIIVDAGQTMRIVSNGASAQIEGKVGDTLSLMALGGDASGVSIEGCEYPLANAKLSLGQTLGISNVLSEPRACVEVQQGIVLVIHKARDE